MAAAIHTHLEPETSTQCPKCLKNLYFRRTRTADATLYKLRCAGCSTVFTHPQTNTHGQIDNDIKCGRTLYSILGVPEDAQLEDIRKSYRRRAAKCHPDKVRGKEEEWKELNKAYTVLSDPSKRRWYDLDKQGKLSGGQPDTAMTGLNLERFFHEIFGGERFEEFIGHISIGRDMAEAISKSDDNHETEEQVEKPKATTDTVAAEQERATERELRVKTLAQNLRTRLDVYANDEGSFDEQNDSENVKHMRRVEKFRQKCREDVEELQAQRFGAELLTTLSFVYLQKSYAHRLSPTRQSWSSYLTTSLPSSFRLKTHAITLTISTMRKAYAVKTAFDNLQRIESEEVVDQDARKKVEEKCAEIAMSALWSGARLEIEGVVGEVCDRALSSEVDNDSKPVDDEKVRRCVEALAILGEAFSKAKSDIPILNY